MGGRGLFRLLRPPVLLCAAIGAPAALCGQEIPLAHCDTLPLIQVTAAGRPALFLVDTAATSLLNLESFTQGSAREIRVTSWRGTLATSAKEVTIADLVVGQTRIVALTLPAIDLSAIGKACGKMVDGILGADLLGKLEATIDLKRQLLRVTTVEERRDQEFDSEIERYFAQCAKAFNDSNDGAFADCLDPKIAVFTANGEFHGREKVLGYVRDSYFHQSPAARLEIYESAFHSIGDAIWIGYKLNIESSRGRSYAEGMAMCRKSDGRWRMVTLHNSVEGSDPEARSSAGP
jgi:ketosteroid isomerase-like protein